MNNLIILTKSIFLNSFRSEGRKKGLNPNGLLAMLLSAGIFGTMFVFMAIFVGPMFAAQGMQAEFLTIIYMMSQMIVLLFGAILLINVLYFSKDAEFLLSLPVKTSTLFVSKLLYVYVSELLFAAFTTIVTGIAFGIIAGFGAVNYILLILSVFLVPILPLIISAIISMPVMYVVSFFKGKSVLATVLLIALFGTFMYFYSSFFMGGNFNENDIELPFEAIKSTIGSLYPNISLAKIVMLTSANFVLDIAIVTAGSAGLIALTLIISSFSFKRGMRSQLEESRGKSNEARLYGINSAYKAFLLKEIREIIRNPGLAFYCIFPAIITPIFIFSFGNSISSSGDVLSDQLLLSSMHLGFSFFFILFMACGMNYTALSSVSREGKNFNMSKTLPAPYTFQMQVKIRLADIVMLFTLIVCTATLVVTNIENILHVALFFVFSLIYGNGINYCLAYIDAKNPKLEWESITVAIKNHKAAFVSMLISAAIGLPMVGGFIAIALATEGLLQVVLFAVYWAVFYGIAIALNIFFKKRMTNNIADLIAKHE